MTDSLRQRKMKFNFYFDAQKLTHCSQQTLRQFIDLMTECDDYLCIRNEHFAYSNFCMIYFVSSYRSSIIYQEKVCNKNTKIRDDDGNKIFFLINIFPSVFIASFAFISKLMERSALYAWTMYILKRTPSPTLNEQNGMWKQSVEKKCLDSLGYNCSFSFSSWIIHVRSLIWSW